jgi:hypothetical protein
LVGGAAGWLAAAVSPSFLLLWATAPPETETVIAKEQAKDADRTIEIGIRMGHSSRTTDVRDAGGGADEVPAQGGKDRFGRSCR